MTGGGGVAVEEGLVKPHEAVEPARLWAVFRRIVEGPGAVARLGAERHEGAAAAFGFVHDAADAAEIRERSRRSASSRVIPSKFMPWSFAFAARSLSRCARVPVCARESAPGWNTPAALPRPGLERAAELHCPMRDPAR